MKMYKKQKEIYQRLSDSLNSVDTKGVEDEKKHSFIYIRKSIHRVGVDSKGRITLSHHERPHGLLDSGWRTQKRHASVSDAINWLR